MISVFEKHEVKTGMKVLDTHLGNKSSRISANKYQIKALSNF